MTPFELGWAAGYFEGEGTITMRGVSSVALQVASVDFDNLDHLQRSLGGKVYGPYGPYQPNRQPHWLWTVASENAIRVLRILLPYLGERRSNRAREVIEASCLARV